MGIRNPTAPTEVFHTRAGIDVEIRPGPAWGSSVTLVVYPQHTEAQVERAKREIRRARDVIMLWVRREVSPSPP